MMVQELPAAAEVVEGRARPLVVVAVAQGTSSEPVFGLCRLI